MKTFILPLLLLMITVRADAQNLVMDPSFEDYDSCSSNAASNIHYLKHWARGTQGSSDYFNYCNSGGVDVPWNFFGYQEPSDSDGYVGVYTYYNLYDTKEYVRGGFSTCASPVCQLTPGLYYEVSIDVSLAESLSNVAGDGIGVYFLTDTLSAFLQNLNTLPITPQIDYSPYGVIDDTLNWTTLVDTFLADSAYSYMIIGGVVENQYMNTIPIDNSSPQLQLAYYYIDNVKVEAISTPLSIVFADISARSAGKSNYVYWNTLSEEGVKWFELERSADGVHFSHIKRIKSQGIPTSYSFTDEDPLNGTNYYRVKVVEVSAIASYSKVVQVHATTADINVHIYLDHAADDVRIDVTGQQAEGAIVRLTDITGKVLKTIRMTDNSEVINMGNYSSGLYLINYAANSYSKTIRIIK